jgi:hypothetical protein
MSRALVGEFFVMMTAWGSRLPSHLGSLSDIGEKDEGLYGLP